MSIGGQSIFGVPKPAYPTRQVFTSGSGIYSKPPGVSYIRVRMVGGGSGGTGSGAASTMGNATPGTATTFGPLTAGGGQNSGSNSQTGGTGGSVTPIPFPMEGLALAGTSGGAGLYTGTTATTVQFAGGDGGSSPFFGPGKGVGAGNGLNAVANSGSGGAGGGGATASVFIGGGGGAGGYYDVIIPNPAACYNYSVGLAGTLGSAGSNGFGGGNGGSGFIEVYEYYI